MFDLTGKTAFVTGSSRGIGRAIGLDLAQAGASVVFHGVKPGDALASAVAHAGAGAQSVCADLGRLDEIEALFQILEERKISPDIVVLNSSVQSYTGIENFTAEEFERQALTNLRSSFLLLQKFLPAMRERRWGRVIAVSSINQLRPAARLALYGSLKSALANTMKVVAKEYAADGITANAIIPGVIETDRNAQILSDPEFAEKLRCEIPMHRFGSAKECAPCVTFLASEEAGYITGAEIPVTGGWQL